MKKGSFTQLLLLTAFGVANAPENALANASRTYPINVNCQIGFETQNSPTPKSIEEVARSCNEFRVQTDLEFNFVKGTCTLGGTLSGMPYAFNDGMCQSQKAAALCRVPVQSTGAEEATWYFEPNSPQNDKSSHVSTFRLNCDELNGSFEVLWH